MSGQELDSEVIVVRNGLGMPVALPGARRLASAKTGHHAVDVITTPHLGRALIMDGHLFQAEHGEVRRAESLIHPMMVLGPILPETVLFLGLPTAPMVRELLRYPGITSIVIAEPDEELPALCREHMPGCAPELHDDPRLSMEHGLIEEVAGRLIAQGRRFDAVFWNPLGHLTRGSHIEHRAGVLPLLPKLASPAGRAVGLLAEEFRIPPRKALVEEVRSVCAIFEQALLMNIVVPELHQEMAVWLAGYSLRRPSEITEYSLDGILRSLGGEPLKWVTAEWIKGQFAIPAAIVGALDRALGQLSPGHWGLPRA